MALLLVLKQIHILGCVLFSVRVPMQYASTMLGACIHIAGPSPLILLERCARIDIRFWFSTFFLFSYTTVF